MAMGLERRKFVGWVWKLCLCYSVLWWRQREVQSTDIAALVTGTHDDAAIDVAVDIGGRLHWDSTLYGSRMGYMRIHRYSTT